MTGGVSSVGSENEDLIKVENRLLAILYLLNDVLLNQKKERERERETQKKNANDQGGDNHNPSSHTLGGEGKGKKCDYKDELETYLRQIILIVYHYNKSVDARTQIQKV